MTTNNNYEYIFASESVSEGHPDKIADQISDAILDAYLAQDANSRVACETLVKNNTVIVAGEFRSNAKVNYQDIVRKKIREIGYTEPELGFCDSTCEVIELVSQQSSDISIGVDSSDNKEQGAGDQGHMFGFACKETSELMPLPIHLSHQLVWELAKQRKSNVVNFIKPDAKSQVTVAYNSKNEPVGVTSVLISTQHSEGLEMSKLKEYITESIIYKVIPKNFIMPDMRILINPTGNFVIGGPVGDCGLTGRKIIVDTYGGYSRHGGGAFSGKDPSKVDRSAAYAARYLAKNVVASGLADKCEIQLSYAIGVAQPTSLLVETFGTSKISDKEIARILQKSMDLSPYGIINHLNLLKPIYSKTASYGHFGRIAEAKYDFPWEQNNLKLDL